MSKRPGKMPIADWSIAPWNRWSFQNVRQCTVTEEVWRGAGESHSFSYSREDLEPIAFQDSKGENTTVGDWLNASYTDGFLVTHRGRIIFENYYNGMTERSLHLSQSMSKSVTAVTLGILIGRGLVDPQLPVTNYLPELENTAYKDAKVQQVLDMASGVAFDEDYLSEKSDIFEMDVASGWRPVPDGYTGPTNVWDQILGLKNKEAEHGSRYLYRSIETDVLAHIMERVTGLSLSELVSRELWSKLGCEESACFTVDPTGYAMSSGGLNATLRDYTRFGQLMLNGGFANGQQIVPKFWVEDTLNCDPSIFGAPYTDALPYGAYRNQFWIEDHRKRAYMALGIYGQVIYINHDYQTVMTKLSTWPEPTELDRRITCFNAFHAIGQALNGS